MVVGYRLSTETLIRCLNGEFGEVRRAEAQDEIDRSVEAMKSMEMDPDGALRWVGSGNYIDRAMCERLEIAGVEFSMEATLEKRDMEVTRPHLFKKIKMSQ